MSGIRISWIEQEGQSTFTSPAERLRAGTLLVSKRPPGEPWLATVRPLDTGAAYKTLALSLGAGDRFADGILLGFSRLCQRLRGRCSDQERSDIADLESRRGNPPQEWVARENLLRLDVPERLLADAKEEILLLFRSVAPLA